MPNRNSQNQHHFKTRKNNQPSQNSTATPNNFSGQPWSANNNLQQPLNSFNSAEATPNSNKQQPTFVPPRSEPTPIKSLAPTTNKSRFTTHQQNQRPTQPTQPPQQPINYNNQQNLTETATKPPYPSNKQPHYQPNPPVVKQQNLQRNAQDKNTSFWKRPVVWILSAIIIIVGVSLGLYVWLQPTKKTTAPTTATPPKTEQTLTSPKKALKHKKVKPIKDIHKQQKSLQANKKAAQPPARDWKNSGSYDDMKYDTDDFTIQLNNSSDGVKLIPDTNNKPALFIEYTFINKSKEPQKPATIVSEDLQLKQNDQLLSATTPAADNHDAQDKLNMAQQEVAPGQKVDTAMMSSINDTKSTISMYFMDLKNHQLLNTNQPFKL
ncbi:DUF5067 domain-containing protein [Bombilactobacillus bombi]|uniref:DUF5067 domain-containing protein n=1 Tax=Bombilactobacillus bombi TaxID=1303590 RepID=UPI0015E5DAAF|nr:DUF5067 domain-containing protein [Bombilactobacillus bombi]MBA1434161.1 DUF5067 domain-containing protein [Bombilactobacillus bombi]